MISCISGLVLNHPLSYFPVGRPPFEQRDHAKYHKELQNEAIV
jgi:hypothetical protein